MLRFSGANSTVTIYPDRASRFGRGCLRLLNWCQVHMLRNIGMQGKFVTKTWTSLPGSRVFLI